LLSFFFYSAVAHRDLPSFPTRRSSDLPDGRKLRGPTVVFDVRGEDLHLVVAFEQGVRGQKFVGQAPERVHVARHGGRLVILRDQDRKSTRLNSSHVKISYAVFCLKKKK